MCFLGFVFVFKSEEGDAAHLSTISVYNVKIQAFDFLLIRGSLGEFRGWPCGSIY